ncbi:hypothetical protein BGZ49_001342 [Haplosporangium sp. Z 27]|nr:hypothetical protein BGZ49_001342 [Haplosporangium sp. Z 27]
MVGFKQILACIMAPVLMIKTVDASFGYCVGINDYDAVTTEYGFDIWNENGDVSFAAAKSAYNNGALVSDGKWTFGIGKFDKNGNIAGLSVRNPTYNFDSAVPFEKICSYSVNGRQKSTFYGCYNNGGNFCQTQGANIRSSCYRVPMWEYSVDCTS